MIRQASLLIAVTILGSSCAVIGPAGDCGGTEILGRFDQVGDLVENATVQSGDVEIGSVTKIALDKQNWVANVTMCLNENENISTDIEAVVRTTSLLGEKFIDLRPLSESPPFLEDGHVIELADTSKATELEDVFARLASVLGTGNLEQINRFTTAQANILRDHAGDLRTVLGRLNEFTGTLASRQDQIAGAVDNLDLVAKTVLDDSDVLERFLESFADSSSVLADQKEALQDLLVSLDEFTRVTVSLLDATEANLDRQFSDLRPVLRTLVENSRNVAETLRTLATFAQWFPETMPGDYLQLDVCQAGEGEFGQGRTCPQAIANDDPDSAARSSNRADNPLEFILRAPMRGDG
jgi:phospholipid/cholesterol/gamma-HCH transport system substrate-binding protein